MSSLEIQKHLTDPKIWGPGTWFVGHTTAASVVKDDDQKRFSIWWDNIIDKLPCLECRTHGKRYKEENPVERYFEMENKTGCLFWSWMFHNSVNRRINKSTITWDTCQNIYLIDGVNFCSSNCGSESKNSYDSDEELDAQSDSEDESINSFKDLSGDNIISYSAIEVTIVDNSIRERY